MKKIANIHVVHLDNAYDALKHYGNTHKWVFWGNRLNISGLDYLKNFDRYYFARELRDVSISNKSEFLNWIFNIGAVQNQNWWQGANLSYVCPLTNDLFLKYCYLVLLKQWIDKQNKIVIITDDIELLLTIKRNHPCVEVEKYHFKGSILRYIKNSSLVAFLQRIIVLMKLMRHMIQRVRFNRKMKIKYDFNIKSKVSQSYDAAFFTWISNYQYNNNQFLDKFLGKIYLHCISEGLSAVYMTNNFYDFDELEKIYGSKNIVPAELYLKYTNVFSGFIKYALMRWNKKISMSQGIDFKNIVLRMLHEDSERIVGSYIYYQVVREIIKRIPLKNIIYPSENQWWEKMIILAIIDSRSNIKTIAYQHGNLPLLYLNYFLGENSDHFPQPDYIFATNSYYKSILEKSGYKSTIVNGGTVSERYNLINHKRKAVVSKNNKNVLVLLPYSIVDSHDMINYLIKNNLKEYGFLIKKHPDILEDDLLKNLRIFPANFLFVNQNVKDLIDIIGYVIYFSTSAAVECLLNGIKIIKYLPESIDLDTLMDQEIPTVTDNDVLCLSEINLTKIKILPISEPVNYRLWDKAIVKSYHRN